MSPVKEAVIRLVQSLPDDCTLDDIHYHLYVREKVESGLRAIEEGKVVSEEEADRRIEEWLNSSGPSQR
jgi:predicted transcriptional regulator